MNEEFYELEKQIFVCRKCEQISSDREEHKLQPPCPGSYCNENKMLIISQNQAAKPNSQQRINEFNEYHKVYNKRMPDSYIGKFIKKVLLLDFKKVYYTNVVKCPTLNNRYPSDIEINNCSKFLKIQLKIIKPKIIITLGKLALKYFIKKDINIHKAASKRYIRKDGVIIIPVLHPAYFSRLDKYQRKFYQKRYIQRFCKSFKEVRS